MKTKEVAGSNNDESRYRKDNIVIIWVQASRINLADENKTEAYKKLSSAKIDDDTSRIKLWMQKVRNKRIITIFSKIISLD